MKKFLIFSLLISFSFLSQAFAEDTLKLLTTRDTCIFEWYPDMNYGFSKYLYLANLKSNVYGTAHGSRSYVIMDFDWSQIDLSKVSRVTLHVNHANSFGKVLSPSDVKIWRFDEPWNEKSTFSSLNPLSFSFAISELRQDGTSNWAVADLPIMAVKNLPNGIILGLTKKDKKEPFFYSKENKKLQPFLLVEY